MKRLGIVNVLGVAVRVIKVTPEEVNDTNLLTNEEHASFSPDDNIVRMNAESSGKRDFQRFNLVHEIIHALLGFSGVRQYLRDLTCQSNEQWEKTEETIVRMLTPSLNSCLETLMAVIRRLK